MTAPNGLQPPLLEEIARQFAIPAAPLAIEPLGRGLINDTFKVTTREWGYVLQRINDGVFPRPEQIMANLRLFTELLGRLDEPGLRIPELILTTEGASFIRDADGRLWRMMELIPDAIGLSRIEHPGQAREIGRVLGGFHRVCAALPIERFGISLPGFHDTPGYLARLRAILAERPARAQTSDVGRLIEVVEEHQTLAEALTAAHRAGHIRRRVTHGDPKIDNILFTRDGARALALIDLDTIQPGFQQHDLGDCLRSCCNRAGEGAASPEATGFDLGVCEDILRGYAGEMRGLLDVAEVAAIGDAIRAIPFELGLRFLTDHLEGDRYFRVDHPGQNLLKAQIQLALVVDIERKADRIERLISGAFAGV